MNCFDKGDKRSKKFYIGIYVDCNPNDFLKAILAKIGRLKNLYYLSEAIHWSFQEQRIALPSSKINSMAHEKQC